MIDDIKIIGGGLAGSEAALVLSKSGLDVTLYEMRPTVQTGAHRTGDFAELVCSNSLKSTDPFTASGLLKEELKLLGSRLIAVAEKYRVPAGTALAVDRVLFSKSITEEIISSRIRVERKEYVQLTEEDFSRTLVLICTGPLTSERLLFSLRDKLDTQEFFFFDAIAPIIESESLDKDLTFAADRYGDEEGHYINIPLDKDTYDIFYEELLKAEKIPVRDFERKYLFDRCQPFEEIARNGYDALRYGPMKPVGLIDPSTGNVPYAVIQLRQENTAKNLYNLVGFQTRLKWDEQRRLLRLIPALRHVEIVRYGVMHKNVFMNSPVLLDPFFQSRKQKNLFFSGQITGIEGYVESIASGFVIAKNILRTLEGKPPLSCPPETMIGSLFNYILHSEPLRPMYANYGILPPIKAKKNQMRQEKTRRAIEKMVDFANRFFE
jgi:methylenetetrahydrofolate--tRNA-(uracil-5-)-methyltransferase